MLQHHFMHENMHFRAMDGTYDTRKCHDAIAARNARAVIPARKNAKLWKPDTLEARARNEAVQSSKDLGRAKWRRLNGYHRRGRVETNPLTHASIYCRAMDALYEITRSASCRTGLRSEGWRDSNSRRHLQWFYRSWHSPNSGCRLNPSGVRGSPALGRFMQQSLFDCISPHCFILKLWQINRILYHLCGAWEGEVKPIGGCGA